MENLSTCKIVGKFLFYCELFLKKSGIWSIECIIIYLYKSYHMNRMKLRYEESLFSITTIVSIYHFLCNRYSLGFDANGH